MNEAAARDVVLLQALETVRPAGSTWTAEDAQWATRLVRSDGGPRGDLGEMVARRARHAMVRWRDRKPRYPYSSGPLRWSGLWVGGAMVLATIAGGLADSIGASQRINLLAPPLWAVIGWNLAVYLALMLHTLGRWARRDALEPSVSKRRWIQRILSRGPFEKAVTAPQGEGAELARLRTIFRQLWADVSTPLWGLRLTMLMHAAAACLAAGLIGGLYLRGLVLDYRANWESTFLSANAVHGFLATMFAPAAALSGIQVPSVQVFESMRSVHGASVPGAPAAPWIHLLALTLALLVVLPRSVLALRAAVRAKWRETHFQVPLSHPYFQHLAAQFTDHPLRAVVVPYACHLSDSAAERLGASLVSLQGPQWQVQGSPTLPYGSGWTSDPDPFSVGDAALAVALFDMAATPEPENHGRFALALAARVRTILAIDETSINERFGAESPRTAQRYEHWRTFAQTLGTAPLRVEPGGPSARTHPDELDRAMLHPVSQAPA